MLSSDEWVTISSLATATGTLVLAIATFAAVRSANHAARVAERSFQFSLRPVLAPSRLEDAEVRIMFGDRHWVVVPGGQASVEVVDGVVYLAMQVRNVGNGLAVIEAWRPYAGLRSGSPVEIGDDGFRPQSRSLWVPPGDVAFWQGAMREPSERLHSEIVAAVGRGELSVELRYRDHEGGQRTVSRFSLVRDDDGVRWWASMTLHFEEDSPNQGPPGTATAGEDAADDGASDGGVSGRRALGGLPADRAEGIGP